MSSILNRVREGVHEATRPKGAPLTATANTTSSTGRVPEGTAGPHNSRVANAADPRVDSDLDNRGTHTTHTHTHTGPGRISPTDNTFNNTGAPRTTTTSGSTNAGPHDSNIANKLDPRVDSDLDGSRNMGMNQTTNRHGHSTALGGGAYSGSTNAGPHDSNMANRADPRVDSDLDGSRNMGMNQTTNHRGHTTTTTGPYSGSTNAGPHDSNIANKMDPRVDSDLDGSRNMGMNQTTNRHGHATTTGPYSGSTNAGPYDSNVANKMDPRVDSDLDGSRNMGMNQTTRGGYGTTHPTTTTKSTTNTKTNSVHNVGKGSTNAGPHKSNLMNKLDPRVDSDLDGGRHLGMNQTTDVNGRPTGEGTFSGSTNAGPHKSNLMNVMDPRVDSDLDGDTNGGLNQTTRTRY